MIKRGTHVTTPLGTGTVTGTEVFRDTKRYLVQLDHPETWSLSKECHGIAAFFEKEVFVIK